MDELTEGEIFILKWQYRKHGHFFTAFTEAMCKADIQNLAKLRKGFPNEIDAYDGYCHKEGWWQEVQEKARKLGWNY